MKVKNCKTKAFQVYVIVENIVQHLSIYEYLHTYCIPK